MSLQMVKLGDKRLPKFYWHIRQRIQQLHDKQGCQDIKGNLLQIFRRIAYMGSKYKSFERKNLWARKVQQMQKNLLQILDKALPEDTSKAMLKKALEIFKIRIQNNEFKSSSKTLQEGGQSSLHGCDSVKIGTGMQDYSLQSRLADYQIQEQLINPCMCCNQVFHQNAVLKATGWQKLVPMQYQEMESDYELAKNLVALLNSQEGVLLVGAVPHGRRMLRVIGIEAEPGQLQRDKQRIYQVLRDFIEPSIERDMEIIRVDTIRVRTHNSQSNKFVLKVYIHTSMTGRAYLSCAHMQGQKQKQDLQMHKVEEDSHLAHPVQPKSFYLELLRQHERPRCSMHPGILCEREIKVFDLDEVNKAKGEVVKQKQQGIVQKANQYFYGAIPFKKYENHTIVLYDSKYQNIYKQFVGRLKGVTNFIEFSPYEKLNNISKRQIVYFSHQTKHNYVHQTAQKFNNEKKRKVIVTMNIKKNLKLTLATNIQKAYAKIKDNYFKVFSTLPGIAFRFDNTRRDFEYYLCFKNEEEALFTFIMLEKEDIRSDFSGDQKLKDATNIFYSENWNLVLGSSDSLEYIKTHFLIPGYNQ